MSFALYLIGYLILIAGLAHGAFTMHVPQRWIIVGVVVLLGLGIATGAVRTRQRDPAE